MSLPPTQFRRVGDIELAYADSGGPGEAVLLLHGAYLAKEVWAAQWTALSAHHRVIAVDLRGHGESTGGIWTFHLPLVAEDLTSLLTALGVRQVHVCGHALGGMVALQLALVHPDRVRSLVLVDTTASVNATPMDTVLSHVTWPLVALLSIRRQAAVLARAVAPGDPALQHLIRTHVLTFEARPEAYRVIWDAMMAFDVLPDLPRITCPTLILVGGRHPVTHGQARRLQQGVPHAELRVIPNAGHLLTLEQPGTVNALLLGFWRGKTG